MTLREYLSDKLRAYGLTESVYADLQVAGGYDPDADITSISANTLGNAVMDVLENVLLMPRLNNVSEGGFSMSWDFAQAAKYYLYLCRRWGRNPDKEILTLIGVSTITDRTAAW